MASFSPEHPDLEPENEAPEQPSSGHAAEPRLLTRREKDEDGSRNRASEPRAVSNTTGIPSSLPARLRRRHAHTLQSLDRLRQRLRRSRVTKEPGNAPSADNIPRRRGALRRTSRRITIALLAFIVFATLALMMLTLFLRHDMTAALPQLDGDLHLAGLTSAVNVRRDAQGVPTIEAGTVSDVLFAQGFVTAQDRLWQMDALRRHAAGELAEILGPSMVDHDRQQRTLQLRAAADRAVTVLPPDQLAELQAYARGVNAFLETNGDRLPVEFHLLHYKPAPWTPRDSLLVALAMFQDLSTTFPGKLRRELFAQHLAPELLADLYPNRSFRDLPPTQPPRDLTAPQPEVLQIPLDDSQVKLHRPASAPMPEMRIIGDEASRCPECRAGSNNWAVSGRHTASGKPMVSNDMHLSLGVPDIWYQAGLHTVASPTEPALDVTGFTLPGVPFVIVGRNAHVAWGFTNLGADVQDIHIEHLRGSGDATEFQQPDGSWASAAHHRELIRVRGGSDRTLDVLTTTAHIGNTAIAAPIISALYPNEHRALSLLWTPYDPQNLNSPFRAVNAAQTGSALVAALAGFGGPSLNLVYADDAGHIGYHAIGRMPIRGPAERRPRISAPQYVPENGNPLPDENPEGEPDNSSDATDSNKTDDGKNGAGEPQARFDAPEGHLLLTAYVRRRAVRPAPRPAQKRAERPAPERPGRRRRVRVEPTPLKQIPDEPIPTPSSQRDYTIGSPIPTVPVDALNAAAQWSGYIPFEELPGIVDPADGVLATANARITPDDYPYFVSDDWAPPYRTERIRRLLLERTGLTPADMLRIQTDTVSAFDRLFAERMVYAVDHASDKALGGQARRLHQAADLLRTWAGGTPGNMATDSPAAAIVAAARAEMWPMLLAPQIARHDHLSSTSSAVSRLVAQYDWGGQTVALESLLTFQPARWLPSKYANWNDFLAAVLARGLADKSPPHDLARWTYGSVHPVDIEHPVLSMFPLLRRLLGIRSGTGPQPIGGDGTTIQATSRAFGPSERFTADLGSPDTNTGNITTGQSGNPRSPHFLDQFPAWLRGTTFAMPLGGSPAQHTLRLLP